MLTVPEKRTSDEAARLRNKIADLIDDIREVAVERAIFFNTTSADSTEHLLRAAILTLKEESSFLTSEVMRMERR
jgi:hypothetical protein